MDYIQQDNIQIDSQNNITINPQLDEEWKTILAEEFKKEYFINLKKILIEEKKKYTIYPPGKLIFNALNLTPPSKVKVVLLGQDPYHNPGQAHGLAFSVQDGVEFPPSLLNIFKELKDDLGYEIPKSGNLEKWAKEGVLLLNAFLTVRKNEPLSHSKIGWENFTDSIIKNISQHKKNVVFLLWGSFAQSKEIYIDKSKHLVLKAPHPSPLSANRGFFGCKHFSKTNSYLKECGIKEIDWKLE